MLKEGQTLKGLYEERTPLYEKYAQLTVDEETLGIRETVELVAEAPEKRSEPDTYQIGRKNKHAGKCIHGIT